MDTDTNETSGDGLMYINLRGSLKKLMIYTIMRFVQKTSATTFLTEVRLYVNERYNKTKQQRTQQWLF